MRLAPSLPVNTARHVITFGIQQGTRETVQIEVILVKPNFHVNISEQFIKRFASARDLLSKGK